MYYDLRTVCYENFLDFIFDHPVSPHIFNANWNVDPHSSACWFDAIDLDIDFDPARNCEYFALLFCDPLGLVGRYSVPQLEQGFWWMQARANAARYPETRPGQRDHCTRHRDPAFRRANIGLGIYARQPLGH